MNWYENLFEFIRYFQVLRYEFLNIYANFKEFSNPNHIDFYNLTHETV